MTEVKVYKNEEVEDVPFPKDPNTHDGINSPLIKDVTIRNIMVVGDKTVVNGAKIISIKEGSELSIQGWQFSGIFSATDYRVVAWTSGVITLMDGQTFTIDAGTTGNMTAITYIYFDKGYSSTVLRITATAATAVGSNKILIAVAQNNSDTTSKATLQVFGGSGGVLITVNNIAANSASVNEFISNTAQIKDAIITNAKIASLEVSKLTAGSITSKAITLAVAAGTGDVYLAAGKTDFTNAEIGLILGIDDSDNDLPKLYIGTTTEYLNFDGAHTIMKGVLSLIGTLQLKSFTVATLPVGNTGLLSVGGISGTTWTNPIKAYSSNNDWATTTTGGLIQTYKTWGLGSIPTQIIPLGSTILGIEVKAEGHGDAANMQIAVSLSWDSGISWTNYKTGTPNLTTDTTITFGSSSDLWGRTWADTECQDNYFYVRIQCSDLGSGTTYELDHLQIRIYYTDPRNPVAAGSVAYASNGRKAGEGAGNGTGVLVFYDEAGNWIACDTGTTVAA